MNLSRVSCECSIYFSGLYGRAEYTSQIWHGDLCVVPKWFFPCSKGVLFQDPCYWYSIYIYIIYICSYVYVCIQVFNVWLTCLHLGSLEDKGRSILRTYIVFLYIVNIVNQEHVGKTDQSSSPNCGTVQCLSRLWRKDSCSRFRSRFIGGSVSDGGGLLVGWFPW